MYFQENEIQDEAARLGTRLIKNFLVEQSKQLNILPLLMTNKFRKTKIRNEDA